MGNHDSQIPQTLFEVKLVHRPKDGEPKIVHEENIFASDQKFAERKLIIENADKLKGLKAEELDILIRPFSKL